jgi:hypothetical protein
MDAVVAALLEGWIPTWFGSWINTDIWTIWMNTHPIMFHGSARDLCLGHGIEFEYQKD